MSNARVSPYNRCAGVTLFELMVVLAIIGIISAIAIPNYSEHVKKTRRADAHLALYNNAQKMERCKAATRAYTNCVIDTESEEGDYTIELISTASTWTMNAQAKNRQAGDSDCATISYSNLGVKSPAACWPD